MGFDSETIKSIEMCRFCFMCRHACPTFLVTKQDSNTPRGYALLVSRVIDGLSDWTPDTVEKIYQCSQCSLCKELCEFHWKEDEIVRKAREVIVEESKAPNIVLKTASSILEEAKSANVSHLSKHPAVLYYPGYRTSTKRPEIINSMILILEKMQLEWSLLDDRLSTGMELHELGFSEESTKTAQRFSEVVANVNPGILLTNCPHSLKALRDDFLKWNIQVPSSVKIMHTTEFLLDSIRNGKLRISRKANVESAGYHDPCNLGRKLGIYDTPRELIQICIGYAPREFLHSRGEAECCGQGSCMGETNPELAAKISENRLKMAEGSGIAVVYSSCQNCVSGFASSKQVMNGKIIAKDVVELVSEVI